MSKTKRKPREDKENHMRRFSEKMESKSKGLNKKNKRGKK